MLYVSIHSHNNIHNVLRGTIDVVWWLGAQNPQTLANDSAGIFFEWVIDMAQES